jgi:hypothetical protein
MARWEEDVAHTPKFSIPNRHRFGPKHSAEGAGLRLLLRRVWADLHRLWRPLERRAGRVSGNQLSQ